MAQGLVTYTNPRIAAAVDQTKVAYLNLRRVMDALIAIRSGNGTADDYEAVAAIVDASIPGQNAIVAGQTAFDNLDAAIAGLTTAYNALSNMDKNAL